MERCTLGIVTQLVLDLYNQDYAPRNQFIDEDQVGPMVANLYTAKLKDEYKQAKFLSKALTGFTFAILSPDWLIEERVETKRNDEDGYHAILERAIFAFDFDATGAGAIQSVSATNKRLVRIGPDEAWQFELMPDGPQIYYYAQRNKIKFLSKSEILPKHVMVQFIPSMYPIDLENPVPESYADEIMGAALQKLLIAKNGVIIDKTNNSNPNVIPQGEIDAESITMRNK